MLFKSQPNLNQDYTDQKVQESRKRHNELVNISAKSAEVVSRIVSDADGQWNFSANGISYKAFQNAGFSVGTQDARVQWFSSGMQMRSDDYSVLVVVRNDDIYYLEESRNSGSQQKTWDKIAEFTIRFDDWRETHNDNRAVAIAAIQYLLEELTTIEALQYDNNQSTQVGHVVLALGDCFSSEAARTIPAFENTAQK